MITSNCLGCGHPVALATPETWVMICQACFSINVCRWGHPARPLHETDILLMNVKTRLLIAFIGAESQLRQLADLEDIA